MKEFQQRRYFRRIFFSRVVFVLFLCLAVLLGISLLGVYKKSRHADLRNKIIEEEVSNLVQRKQALDASLKQLENPLGVEEELRKRFQIKRPGEEYVVILDRAVELPEDLSQKDKWAFFEKILEFFR
jgi:cell division protein FtsB